MRLGSKNKKPNFGTKCADHVHQLSNTAQVTNYSLKFSAVVIWNHQLSEIYTCEVSSCGRSKTKSPGCRHLYD